MQQLEDRRLVETRRRAELAKTRRTRLIAVCAAVSLAAIGLTVLALDQSRQMTAAEEAHETAIRQREADKEHSRSAQARLEVFTGAVDALDGQILNLSKLVAGARDDVYRKLSSLFIAKRAADRRLAIERARRRWIDMHPVIDVSECVASALGCLK